MDNEIKSLLEELKSLGINDNKLVAIVMLSYEEFLDVVEEDLLEASDEDLQKLEEKISGIHPENMMPEELTVTMISLLKDIYGTQAESKYKSFLLDYLKETVQDAHTAKDLITRVQNGDPEAIEILRKAQDDPDFDAIQKAVEETGQL